jgi:Stress responsive A/B Barrel Domain
VAGPVIRHIVFFSVCNAGDHQKVGEGLTLLTAIPHGRFEIGRNLSIDALSAPVDFVVYGEFADEAELAAYKAHSLYQESIKIVRPLREMRVAADFAAKV